MLSTGKNKKKGEISLQKQILFIMETVQSWIVKYPFKQRFLLYFNLWEHLRIPSTSSQKTLTSHSKMVGVEWTAPQGLLLRNIFNTVCQVHTVSSTPPPCFSRHLNFSSNVVLLAFSNMECIKRKPINKCLHMLVRKKADTSDWSICQQEGVGTAKSEGSRILRVRASPRSRCSAWTFGGKRSGLV